MRITKDFTGGNICVKEQKGNTFYLENELRDTKTDWFYWAFCVEGAEGETLTFNFQQNRNFTSRHHACEATGTYILEGVLTELIEKPIPNTKVFCVPFVDFDGVVEGDQGKERIPHDHNRDYPKDGGASIYPECEAIRKYAEKFGCTYAFDFHSPWHKSGQNDWLFIVQNSVEKLDALNRFGEMLENNMTEKAMKYYHKNDYAPNVGWNQSTPNFGQYMAVRPENILGFSFETTYFGEADNIISQEKMIETGKCFAITVKEFDKYENT